MLENLDTDKKIELMPREKLLALGAKSLYDYELLAILLGSGNKEDNVIALAKKILTLIDQKSNLVEANDLIKVKGIGQAKACLIAASLEFARRRIRPEGVKIRSANDILPLVSHISDRKQEHFICISLNGAHEVIATRIITIGLVNAAQVHPREVFCDPISDRACAIIVAHNHPSGDLTPSTEDRQVTQKLHQAGKTLGINLLDHIIFSQRGYFSFQESGLI